MEALLTERMRAFMETEKAFIRVYRLPKKLTNGYCFGGGVPITFTNVDWFEAPVSEGRAMVASFIKRKAYFDREARFLVQSDHPDFTFMIEPEAAP